MPIASTNLQRIASEESFVRRPTGIPAYDAVERIEFG